MFYPYAFIGRSDRAQIISFQREYNHTTQALKKSNVTSSNWNLRNRIIPLRKAPTPSNFEYFSSNEKFKLLAAIGSAPAKVCIRYKLSKNGDNSPTILVL